MRDNGADARKAEILDRAKATLARLAAAETPEKIAEDERRRAHIDSEKLRAWRENRERRAPPPQEQHEAEKHDVAWTRVAVNITRDRAEELCRKAWDAPFVRGGCGDQAAIRGNCVNKALWLQERLGGIVVSGWAPGRGHHAALLFACDGELCIADHSKVMPVGDYIFHFDGFYHR